MVPINWTWSSVRQIWSQIKKLIFLKTTHAKNTAHLTLFSHTCKNLGGTPNSLALVATTSAGAVYLINRSLPPPALNRSHRPVLCYCPAPGHHCACCCLAQAPVGVLPILRGAAGSAQAQVACRLCRTSPFPPVPPGQEGSSCRHPPGGGELPRAPAMLGLVWGLRMRGSPHRVASVPRSSTSHRTLAHTSRCRNRHSAARRMDPPSPPGTPTSPRIER